MKDFIVKKTYRTYYWSYSNSGLLIVYKFF